VPWIGIGQIWVVVAVLLIALFVYLGRRSQANQELMRDGIHGTAQVLGAEQTGMYVNNQPQVKLRLRVQAPGVEPYELDKRVTVPLIALGTLSSGRPLAVAIDPGNREKIAIDWGGSGAAPATLSHEGGPPIDLNANPAARDAAVRAMRDHGIEPGGEVDLRSDPEARAAVLEALKKHGIDAAHGEAAADPSTTVTAEEQEKGEPLDRLTKLMQLRAANLITDEELQQYRKRILDEV
jgi:hypothetical protein